jgi:hypothetical protein
MMRAGAIFVCAAALALPQSKPFEAVAFCSPEKVQNLSLPCSAEEPCPLFLELAATEQVGPRIVVTGNIHTGSTTLESILLISDDGGRTWTEPHARVAASVLDNIQFLDIESGWINGHVLTNVPRDPFFLLTTDGGKTWRKRPVTSESRTGAVEQFWFDSRTSGRLTLDRLRGAENGLRYEMWESMTAGESWSIRQVDSRPLPFKRPERAPTLRLVTDAKTKTYRLERRDGENWTAVSAFSVSAGQCKPEAPAQLEAPPPPPAEPEPAPTSAPRKPPSLKKP